jgi:hypothetical protein
MFHTTDFSFLQYPSNILKIDFVRRLRLDRQLKYFWALTCTSEKTQSTSITNALIRLYN